MTPTPPQVVLVMGVAGCGKSTIGRALADALDLSFIEADMLHSPENVEKMRRGNGLTEQDREPWLAAVADAVERCVMDGRGAVVACSALRAAYRERIAAAAENLRVVWLDIDRQTARTRLSQRQDHFFPPALVDSQFAALEPPCSGGFDGTKPVARLVDEIVGWLARAAT